MELAFALQEEDLMKQQIEDEEAILQDQEDEIEDREMDFLEKIRIIRMEEAKRRIDSFIDEIL
jgi:hypothetical protein